MALQCELYNAALEERTMTYEWLRRGISTTRVPSKFDQFKTLTGLCELRPEFGSFGISVCRGTLTRLDEAFRGYFRRIKAGQAPGYPRFRSVSRWDSLSWSDVSGWKLTESSRRLYLQGVGHVKANLHNPASGNTQDPCGPPERPSPRGDGVLRRCAQDRAWPDRQLDRDRPRYRCIGGHLGRDSSPQRSSPPPARPGPCPGTTRALVTPPRLAPSSQSQCRDRPC